MSGHTSSLTHVARIVLAGAVIGLGALATAGQASADPVPPPLRCRAPALPSGTARAGSPRGRGRRCAGAATSRRTVRAGGPEPAVRIGNSRRPVGLPAGRLASSQGPLQFRRNAAWRDARRGPTPAGSRSGAAAATRIHVAERPGVQRASVPTEGGPPLPPGYYPLNGPPPPPGYFERLPARPRRRGWRRFRPRQRPSHATKPPPE